MKTSQREKTKSWKRKWKGKREKCSLQIVQKTAVARTCVLKHRQIILLKLLCKQLFYTLNFWSCSNLNSWLNTKANAFYMHSTKKTHSPVTVSVWLLEYCKSHCAHMCFLLLWTFVYLSECLSVWSQHVCQTELMFGWFSKAKIS